MVMVEYSIFHDEEFKNRHLRKNYGTIRFKNFKLEMDCALGKYPNKALLIQYKYEMKM